MEKYLGLQDIDFIFNGSGDSEVKYKDHTYYVFDIEDSLYSYYNEIIEEKGLQEEEFSFEKWLIKNTDEVYNVLDGLTPNDLYSHKNGEFYLTMRIWVGDYNEIVVFANWNDRNDIFYEVIHEDGFLSDKQFTFDKVVDYVNKCCNDPQKVLKKELIMYNKKNIQKLFFD